MKRIAFPNLLLSAGLLALAAGCPAECPPDRMQVGQACILSDGGMDGGTCDRCETGQVCYASSCYTPDQCTAVLGVPCEIAGPQYLKAGQVLDNALFGKSSAINLDGTVLAIGAPGETDETGNLVDAGAVYVFRRNGDQWMQEARLSAPVPTARDEFGNRVGLSDDGNLLVIAAPGSDSALPNGGELYVYRRQSGSWVLETRVVGSTSAQERLGQRLSVSGDGMRVAGGSLNSNDNRGAVHVFRDTGSGWIEDERLRDFNIGNGDHFFEIDLDHDGNTLAIGARGDDAADAGIGVDPTTTDLAVAQAGAVYLYVETETRWSQAEFFKAPVLSLNQEFGAAVALSANGAVLAVGAPKETSERGAAYVYGKDEERWVLEGRLSAPRATSGMVFGRVLSLSANGERLAVAARGEAEAGIGINPSAGGMAASSGAALLFRREPTGTWLEETRIKASNTDGGDSFASHLSMSGDGNWLLVGAENEASDGSGADGNPNDNSLTGAGAGYVFRIR